ncbi:hypothetical protein Glove_642g6 [Diversispora epigaea]|uniref:Uncharacterized protein n=1 Tax=Diversispora epigaea TaxID=1348612 RepID=A0A397G4K8_9GLOM|nr:hypothetical protein Glove_642g6 [Diversispora epigaea]
MQFRAIDTITDFIYNVEKAMIKIIISVAAWKDILLSGTTPSNGCDCVNGKYLKNMSSAVISLILIVDLSHQTSQPEFKIPFKKSGISPVISSISLLVNWIYTSPTTLPSPPKLKITLIHKKIHNVESILVLPHRILHKVTLSNFFLPMNVKKPSPSIANLFTGLIPGYGNGNTKKIIQYVNMIDVYYHLSSPR